MQTTVVHVGPSVVEQQQQEPKAEGDHLHKPSSITETLTLRLVPRRKKKGVKWTDDTEEINEYSGKRKSKKCCIFHKRRTFGDWSDSDSDDECQECGEPGAPPPGGPQGPQPPQDGQGAPSA